MSSPEDRLDQNPLESAPRESQLPEVYVHPLFTYYPPTGIVERDGEQFSVLPRRKRIGFNELFLQHPNRPVSIEDINNSQHIGTHNARSVHVWVANLRKRFSPDPAEASQILVNIRGSYLFRDESRPVELIPQTPEYTDFHVRVKRESADQFESVMNEFGNLVQARRLQVGTEVVLVASELSKRGKSRLEYPNTETPLLPEIDGGTFTFDPNNQNFVVGDKIIKLTPNEAKLAYLLMMNNGRVVTQERMRVYLQNANGEVSEKSYIVHLGKIKSKLKEAIADFEDPFETVREKGVIFHGPPKAE